MGKEGEFRNEVTHQIHVALFFSLPSCEPDVCLWALRPSQQTPEDRRWNWWPSTRLLGWSSLWIMNIVLTFSLAQDFRLSSTLGSLRIYRGDMKYHTKLCALQHSSQMQMDEGISKASCGRGDGSWVEELGKSSAWSRSRNHGNSSNGHSTPTSNNTLKRHQPRRKPVLLWAGLWVREI